MLLKVIEDGSRKDIPIKEGEIFLLPPNVPHSPQRFESTVGLVIEYKREDGALDGFQWYCDTCNKLLYEEFFVLTDIVTQLPPLFKKYWDTLEYRTCNHCGSVQPPPLTDFTI